MTYLFYVILGLLPSLIWLAFYLRKDKHPEPNSMVIRVFIWGILLAPLAIVLEIGLVWVLDPGVNPLTVLSDGIKNGFLKMILISAVIPAVVEEYLKYSVIKRKIIKNPEFDEPIDAMLYCIIAALGFAAVENLLILFGSPLMPINEALGTIGLRFLGATFVHALASGFIGYWLALSVLETKKRKRLIFIGLLLAIIFHAGYNYLIITAVEINKSAVFLVIILLIAMAAIVSRNFRKLKNLSAVCKI
jgi:protease PrsW